VLEALQAIRPGRASLRFSFSRFTTEEDIDYAVNRIANVMAGRKAAGQAQETGKNKSVQ
jgi:cysteine sulfinate desulfinase/cysteine desulfurase-like protein